MTHKYKKAFSLLEITISLSIIALIVAAITAGQRIKHRTELAQIVSDVSNINDAFVEFESTYSGLPGDLWNAESIFGASETDNGDGDNAVESGGSPNESLLFWQHLELAGLIDGTYDGSSTTAGVGRMAGPLKDSVYQAVTDSGSEKITIEKDGVSFGGGILSVKDALNFDIDYDDGDPWNGNIRASDGNDVSSEDCVCGGMGCTPTGSYNVTNTTGTPCKLDFIINDDFL